MNSLKNFQSNGNTLSATEMVQTKGGTTITVSAPLDICLIDPKTGETSLIYCDRRKRRVGAAS